MKKGLSILILVFGMLIAFSNNAYCKNFPKEKIQKHFVIKKSVFKILNLVFRDDYIYILLDDGCFHLARINEPGYTDSEGNTYTGYSITFMNYTNYIGDTTICPPGDDEYC